MVGGDGTQLQLLLHNLSRHHAVAIESRQNPARLCRLQQRVVISGPVRRHRLPLHGVLLQGGQRTKHAYSGYNDFRPVAAETGHYAVQHAGLL